MNCAEFDEIVHDLDRRGAGGLSSARPAGAAGPTPRNAATTGDNGGPEGATVFSDAVLAHAESCSRCARLLTEIEGLNFALHAIAARDAQEQAPAEIEAALLLTFREQAAARNGQAASGRQIARRLRSYGWYAAVASAAAIVLFAIGLMRGWVGTPPLQPVANPTSANAGASTGPATAPNLPESQGLETGSSVNSQPAQVPTTAEDATAFYALPYADDAASIEGGAVIRVSVSRSALVAWGLPVPGMGGAQPIPADLLVSADGTPQAIRLVSETNE